MKYTLDADSISAILRNEEIIKKRVEYSIWSGDVININAISYYQVRRRLLCKDTKNQSKIFDKLCKDFDIILMDNLSIFDKAAEIYAGLGEKKDIGDCDILIASIACVGNFTVVTNNVRHFSFIQEFIKDLSIENWLN